MTLPVPIDLEPMEAEPVDALPDGEGLLFEPKYDGFRCVVFRDGGTADLRSRRQRPLARFFPEMEQAALGWPIARFVMDGELVIPGQNFDALQMRLHPAASRVARLSKEIPARFVAFDLLADQDGASLLDRPFAERRAALEKMARKIGQESHFIISQATKSPATARGWLRELGHGLDGIVAKRLDLPYQPGKRAMLKYKLWRTVDCVVGGLYRDSESQAVEYLLMGLYDGQGRLTYVGRCGVGDQGAVLAERLAPLEGGPGFAVNAPGGKSRWGGGGRPVVNLRPELVAEVSVDHIEAGRFRHGSRLLRWRDDKAPERCTLDQLESARSGQPATTGLRSSAPPRHRTKAQVP